MIKKSDRISRINIKGVKISLVDYGLTLKFIEDSIKRKRKVQIVTLNTLMFMNALENDEFRRVINRAELVVPDSVGISWALRKFAGKAAGRITGIGLMYKSFELANRLKLSVFLLGSKPMVLQRLDEMLKKNFPGIKIIGNYHGYFDSEREKDIVVGIRKASPDILLVALGSPRQELWISRNKGELKFKVAIGVGGGFDTFSGSKKRAPGIIRNAGLEWLFRIIQRPYRFYILFILLWFVIIIIFDLIKSSKILSRLRKKKGT